MRTVIFLFLIVFFVSCNSKNTSSIERLYATETIVINPDQVDRVLDLSTILEDSVDIIPLETSDSCLISGILRMEITKTKIIISDRMTQKILLFDSLGNYVKTIGKRGSGPGEYARLGDFAVIGDSIFIQDSAANKCIIYNMSNNQYTEQAMTLSYIEILPFRDILYFISDNLKSAEGNFNLFKYDLQSHQVVERTFPFVENEKVWIPYRHASKCGDKALLIYPMNDTVYEVSRDHYYPAYTIQFTSRNLPKEVTIESNSNLYRTMRQKKYLKGLSYVQNSLNYLLGFYVDGDEFRYLLFDKETHEQKIGKRCVIGRLGDLYSHEFLTTSNNELVITQSASMLLSNWKPSACESSIVKKRMDKLLANIQEESNPILFKYKMKK